MRTSAVGKRTDPVRRVVILVISCSPADASHLPGLIHFPDTVSIFVILAQILATCATSL